MLLSSFQQTIYKYNIPKRHFDELLEGMYMDLNKSRYRNFNELFLYCYRVAGVIGLIMIKILGYKDKEAEKHAVDLGVAMQLTNILRDIKEDYRRGRIYLPQDEMRQYGISEKNIAGNFHNKNSNEFLKFQIQRARTYYKNAACVIKLMKDINARFVVELMKELYSGILDVIEKNNYNIYKRAYVNKTKKVYLLLKVVSTGDYL
jgi:phytoene synthase